MKIETKDLILKTYISKEDIEKIHQNVIRYKGRILN